MYIFQGTTWSRNKMLIIINIILQITNYKACTTTRVPCNSVIVSVMNYVTKWFFFSLFSDFSSTFLKSNVVVAHHAIIMIKTIINNDNGETNNNNRIKTNNNDNNNLKSILIMIAMITWSPSTNVSNDWK
jgi:hypothetical protein